MNREIENHLSHYGVKGMKWGVRKKRTKKEQREINRRKSAAKSRRTLSDGDLKAYIDRLETEKKLKNLVEEDLAPGKRVAKKLMSEGGQKVVKTVATGAVLYGIKAGLTKKFNLSEAAGYIAPKPKFK